MTTTTVKDFYSVFTQANQVTIDSRAIQKGDVFFALKGTQTDGNAYAHAALEKGALAAIVDDASLTPQEGLYFVDDSLTFLQDLAKYHRNQLQTTIVGLTGSNGKTTTKELMAAVVSQQFSLYYTQGNFNNHIGVPLTLLSIKPSHQVAIVEMGANHQKEIEFLCSLSQPDWGYITNFGKAHLEGFGGVEGVIKGKSELYDYLRNNHKKAIVNHDDDKQVQQSQGIDCVYFGKGTEYDFQWEQNADYLTVIANSHTIASHVTGTYNFTNISAAITLGRVMGMSWESIQKGIEHYIPTNNRSQIIKSGNTTIIMDAYNANPSSMHEALQNLARFSGSKGVILGDMYELGDYSEKEHQTIAESCDALGYDTIYLVGEHFAKTHCSGQKFNSLEDLKKQLEQQPITVSNLLIKGSRGMKLEEILPIITSS